jgi:hypothetical protein
MPTRTTTQYVLAAGLILLGVLIAITGWYIFPVCEMDGKFVETKAGKLLPMPCGYTARAETGLGALVALAGIGLLGLTSYDSRRAFGVMTAGLGVVVLLVPTALIGMCAAPDHICRVATQPALILLGGITVLVGGYLILARNPASS